MRLAALHEAFGSLEAAWQASSSALLAAGLVWLLLERGSVRLRAGDGEGARADWQRVVEVAPDTDQAAAAAARLARLDGAGG